MKWSYLLFVCLFSSQLWAQFPKLSSNAEVSLITVGPGKHLYDAFGHSAFRVKDDALGLDRVYNYGTYDSFEEGFYVQFSMGTADYHLSAYDFSRFLTSYSAQNRWLKEQVLNLSPDETQAVFEFLENNHLPQNRYYRYDQFFDNCATKLRDVVRAVLGEKLVFQHEPVAGRPTLRDLVDENTFNHPWGDFGIDMALGNVIDQTPQPEQYLYLPDYVFDAFENARIERLEGSVPAVKETRILHETNFYEAQKEVLSPMIVLTILALLVMVFTLKDYSSKKRTRLIDFLLFFITGLLGLLLLFLWFGTHHSTTINNMNILWAFAPNVVVAFVLLKKRTPVWVRVYTLLMVILLLAAVLVWVFQLQNFNAAMIPFMLMLAFRYVFLWQKGLLTKP